MTARRAQLCPNYIGARGLRLGLCWGRALWLGARMPRSSRLVPATATFHWPWGLERQAPKGNPGVPGNFLLYQPHPAPRPYIKCPAPSRTQYQ